MAYTPVASLATQPLDTVDRSTAAAEFRELKTHVNGITTVASAATPDIFNATAKSINYTGALTATGFVAAPQAGAERLLYCTGAAVFTASANLIIDGTPTGNLTVAAGYLLEVIALTTTQFKLLQISPIVAVTATNATNATNLSGGTVNATTGSFSGLISANGGQIAFPAAQNASADPNTLDDYERGTWTPSLGGTATYISNTGSYTKTGNRVFFAGYFNINTIGTGTNASFSGFPFNNGEASISAFAINNSQFLVTTVVSISGGVNLGASTAGLYSRSSASASDNNGAVLGSGSIISFSGHYKI